MAELLARAEVLFGIPDDSPEGLAAVVRRSQRLPMGTGHRSRHRRAGEASSAAERHVRRLAEIEPDGVATLDTPRRSPTT